MTDTAANARPVPGRLAGLAFAIAGFVMVHLVFAYLVFWLANLFPARTISSQATMGAGGAIFIDLCLIALFGLQHSGMARTRFKALVRRLFDPALDRAAYVWASVAGLFVVVHFYQPVPDTVWDLRGTLASPLVWIAFVAGWGIAAAAYLSAGNFYLRGVS